MVDFLVFCRFCKAWGVWNDLKWSVGPVRSISQSPFLMSTILDPFRLDFGCPQSKLLGAFGAWGKHFRKIDPGIWDPAWNHEKMKVAPRNSVQNPGLEIFRALLCVRKRAFPFMVIYVFVHVLSPWRRRLRRNNFGILSGYPSTPGPR